MLGFVSWNWPLLSIIHMCNCHNYLSTTHPLTLAQCLLHALTFVLRLLLYESSIRSSSFSLSHSLSLFHTHRRTNTHTHTQTHAHISLAQLIKLWFFGLFDKLSVTLKPRLQKFVNQPTSKTMEQIEQPCEVSRIKDSLALTVTFVFSNNSCYKVTNSP